MKLLTKQELQQILSSPSKYFLLDTREAEEYNEGKISGAILAPWHEITEKVSGLKPETPLILYCRTNGRAKKAAHLLEQAGFTDVSVYAGGWTEWNS